MPWTLIILIICCINLCHCGQGQSQVDGDMTDDETVYFTPATSPCPPSRPPSPIPETTEPVYLINLQTSEEIKQRYHIFRNSLREYRIKKQREALNESQKNEWAEVERHEVYFKKIYLHFQKIFLRELGDLNHYSGEDAFEAFKRGLLKILTETMAKYWELAVPGDSLNFDLTSQLDTVSAVLGYLAVKYNNEQMCRMRIRNIAESNYLNFINKFSNDEKRKPPMDIVQMRKLNGITPLGKRFFLLADLCVKQEERLEGNTKTIYEYAVRRISKYEELRN